MSRELSCFFVKELLPLYLEENIDRARREQVASHLKTCTECRSHFEKMKAARDQVAILSQTQVAPQMIAYLKEEHHFWTEFFAQWGWKKWPATTQWIAQLSSVALVLILTIHYFPWYRLANSLQKMKPTPIVADAPPPLPPIVKEPSPVVAQENNEATDGDESKPVTPVAPAQAPASVVKAPPVATPAPVTETAEERTNRDEEEGSQSAGVVAEGTSKGQGYVWRGSLKVEEITEPLGARVTKAIEDLGGTKAGQVELGWRRGKQRYYHFILPDENYEKLLSLLNGEGLVQLKKEKHSRVIKKGHMRIIMTIDEAAE